MRKLLTEEELTKFHEWRQQVDKGDIKLNINCSLHEYFAINVLKKDIIPTETLAKMSKEAIKKEIKSMPSINIPKNPGKITCMKCLEDKKISNKRWTRLIEKKGIKEIETYVCKECRGEKDDEDNKEKTQNS